MFKTALVNTVAPAGIKGSYSSEPNLYDLRHLPRKHIGWKNSSTFINGSNIDDGELFVREEHGYYDLDEIDFRHTSDTRHHTEMKVSLVDIARPAKRKGAAKDFEVVQTVQNVVVLEDEFESLGGYEWEDDEWEQIFDERHSAEERTSYSSVLRGNET